MRHRRLKGWTLTMHQSIIFASLKNDLMYQFVLFWSYFLSFNIQATLVYFIKICTPISDFTQVT